MAAIGIQVLYDGEELAKRFAELDPKLTPALGVWLARYEDTRAFDRTLATQLTEISASPALPSEYVSLIVGTDPAVLTTMLERTQAVGAHQNWVPYATVLIAGEVIGPVAAAGNQLAIAVPSHSGGVPLGRAAAERMKCDWVAFLVEMCRGTNGLGRWDEWFNVHAPAATAGAEVRHGAIRGLIERTTFQPQTILRRLSENMAARVADELCNGGDGINAPRGVQAFSAKDEERAQAFAFVPALAETTTQFVCGSDIEYFHLENAEARRHRKLTQLPAAIASQVVVSIGKLQNDEIKWQAKFRRDVDGHLHRHSIAGLPNLLQILERERNLIESVQASGSTANRDPSLPSLAGIAAAHAAWAEAIDTREPAAASLLGLSAWLAILTGLATAIGVRALDVRLAPVTSHPAAPNPAVPGSWLGGHAASFGFELGALVSVAAVVVLHALGRRFSISRAQQRRAELDEVVETWQSDAQTAVQNVVNAVVARHRQRSREFRLLTIAAEEARVKCVATALRENALKLKNQAPPARDAIPPAKFYAEAAQTAHTSELIATLRDQLGASSWRTHLDFMDPRRILALCQASYGDFRDGTFLQKHQELLPHIVEAVSVRARASRDRLAQLSGGAQGQWLLAVPVGTDVESHLFDAAEKTYTQESVYVAFISSATKRTP